MFTLRFRALLVGTLCLSSVASFAEGGVTLSTDDQRLYDRVKSEISLQSFNTLNTFQKGMFGRLIAGETTPSFDRMACFQGPVPDDVMAAFNANFFGGADKFEPVTFRWTTTATDGSGLATGDPTTITYSFLNDGATIPGDPGIMNPTAGSDLVAFLDGIYGSTALWQAEFAQMFNDWGGLAGVTYVFESNDDGAPMPQSGVTNGSAGILGIRGDVRIGGYSIDGDGAGILAFNFFPNSGDMVIDTDNISFYSDLSNDSRALRNTLGHEAGHGLGLPHTCPTDGSKLMEPFINTNFDGPQLDDVLSAQKVYDDANVGNNATGTAASLGALSNETSNTTDVALYGNATAAEDFYSFSLGASQIITVTVIPLGFSYLSGPQNMGGSCSAGTAFNPLLFMDLDVEIIDTDGMTVLDTAAATAAGVAETANVITIGGAGTYYARVFTADGNNNVQSYNLSVMVADGAVGPQFSNESGGGLFEIADGSATLHFDVTNTVPPVFFEWRKNGTPLVDGGNIAGSTTDTLTIDPIDIADTGNYTLGVSDGSKGVVFNAESPPISLTVVLELPVAGLLGLGLLAGGCAAAGLTALRRQRRE